MRPFVLNSYVLFGFVAAGRFARRERWAWWALTARRLSWFLLDSAVSILHGASFNGYRIHFVTRVG